MQLWNMMTNEKGDRNSPLCSSQMRKISPSYRSLTKTIIIRIWRKRSKQRYEKNSMGNIWAYIKTSLEEPWQQALLFLLSYMCYSSGSECRTISPSMKQKIEAVGMWFYRRMLRISWTEHATNEEVLRRAGAKRKLINTTKKRQLQFLVGHVMRKEDLENLTLTGRIEGTRSRGRQRITYLKSVSKWMAEGIPSKAS